jgi:hypothetical protein
VSAPPGPEAIRKRDHAPDTYKYLSTKFTGINVRVRSEDYSISACYRAAMREALFR